MNVPRTRPIAARLSAERVVELLGLQPHPLEGGFFRETWRSSDEVEVERLNGRYVAGTAIYYLLTPDTFSEMHRLPIDEVFHFYLGDPVEMLWLSDSGGSRVLTLGTDLATGQLPQITVPADTWQGSRLAEGHRRHGYALLGTTVSPSFEVRDYERGARAMLTEGWPDQTPRIDALTRG
ncbi:MAG: cupin domain-containing protein [Acidobacteriota bacterium]